MSVANTLQKLILIGEDAPLKAFWTRPIIPIQKSNYNKNTNG